MFLQACVCPQEGVSASVHAGIPSPLSRPPWEQTPPSPLGADTPPGADPPEQTPPRTDPPWSRHPPEQTPPWERWPLLRTVRILLECILVLIAVTFWAMSQIRIIYQLQSVLIRSQGSMVNWFNVFLSGNYINISF